MVSVWVLIMDSRLLFGYFLIKQPFLYSIRSINMKSTAKLRRNEKKRRTNFHKHSENNIQNGGNFVNNTVSNLNTVSLPSKAIVQLMPGGENMESSNSLTPFSTPARQLLL